MTENHIEQLLPEDAKDIAGRMEQQLKDGQCEAAHAIMQFALSEHDNKPSVERTYFRNGHSRSGTFTIV